jgi:hypothetical protein
VADALWDLWGRLAAARKTVAVAPGAWVHHVRLSAEEGADYDERAAAGTGAALPGLGIPDGAPPSAAGATEEASSGGSPEVNFTR